jgi:transcriptional regulator with XRE-family HTH domain
MHRTSLSSRVGLAVKKRRQALGMQQGDAAKRLRMRRAHYDAIERGEKKLHFNTLERICAVLEVQMWEIMRDAEE